MNTLPSTLPDSKINTFDPEPVNISGLLPEPDPQQHEPTSDARPIDSEGDTPKVPIFSKQNRPYYLPDVSWEGMVLEVLDDSFIVRLVNIVNPSQQEEAEILNTSVSDEDDLKLIVAGAIFYWSIGRHVKGRRSELFSLIQFRRLPVWTKKEKELATQEASKLRQELGW